MICRSHCRRLMSTSRRRPASRRWQGRRIGGTFRVSTHYQKASPPAPLRRRGEASPLAPLRGRGEGFGRTMRLQREEGRLLIKLIGIYWKAFPRKTDVTKLKQNPFYGKK